MRIVYIFISKQKLENIFVLAVVLPPLVFMIIVLKRLKIFLYILRIVFYFFANVGILVLIVINVFMSIMTFQLDINNVLLDLVFLLQNFYAIMFLLNIFLRKPMSLLQLFYVYLILLAIILILLVILLLLMSLKVMLLIININVFWLTLINTPFQIFYLTELIHI